MLRNVFSAFCLIMLLVLPAVAMAEDAPAPLTNEAAAPTDTAAPIDPLTVSDLKIDKSDDNAVKAKEKATIEAKRQAVTILAQRVLEPSAVASFKLPTDQIIDTLIKDFEVKNEKLSKNRYLADFTVRFNEGAPEYIGGRMPTLGTNVATNPSPATPPNTDNAKPTITQENSREVEIAPAQYTKNTGKHVVLILPYYKNPYGKNLLWEDPNPWRSAWQELGGAEINPNLSIVVPTGDLEDVSFGGSIDIWKGDLKAINHLKEKYGATDITIALSYLKDSMLDVELHNFSNDAFKYNDTVQASYKGDYKAVIGEVLKSKSLIETPDESLTPAAPANEAQKTPAGAVGKAVQLQVSMVFNSFKDWMEVQKRVAKIYPAVKINIISLNSAQVKFNIDLSSDDAKKDLENKFYAQGLLLKTPDFNYGYAGDNTDKAIYRYTLNLSE